jgi:hypothetical protein
MVWKRTQIDNTNCVSEDEWVLLELSVITELNNIKSSHDLYIKSEKIHSAVFYKNHQAKILNEKTVLLQ